MSEAFDPYRKWLGIPPNEQPPNHYRLLGIASFEDDPDVIDNAASRQMAHIRTFQSGKNGPASQRIMNELTAAKLCLLQAEKKAAYDEQLRAQLAAANALAEPAPVPQPYPGHYAPPGWQPAGPPIPPTVHIGPPVPVNPLAVRTAAPMPASMRRKQSSSAGLIIGVVAVVALVAVGGLAVVFKDQLLGESATVSQPPPQPATIDPPPSGETAPNKSGSAVAESSAGPTSPKPNGENEAAALEAQIRGHLASARAALGRRDLTAFKDSFNQARQAMLGVQLQSSGELQTELGHLNELASLNQGFWQAVRVGARQGLGVGDKHSWHGNTVETIAKSKNAITYRFKNSVLQSEIDKLPAPAALVYANKGFARQRASGARNIAAFLATDDDAKSLPDRAEFTRQVFFIAVNEGQATPALAAVVGEKLPAAGSMPGNPELLKGTTVLATASTKPPLTAVVGTTPKTTDPESPSEMPVEDPAEMPTEMPATEDENDPLAVNLIDPDDVRRAREKLRLDQRENFARAAENPFIARRLAKDLFSQGEETDEAAEKCALFEQAVELAAKLNDIESVVSYAEALAGADGRPVAEVKLKYLQKCAPKEAGQAGELLAQAKDLMEQNSARNPALALKFCELALKSVRLAKDPAVGRELNEKKRELTLAARE